MEKGMRFAGNSLFGFRCSLNGGKKGISAIVATVLIILITVAAVSIIWVAVIPMIQNSFELSDLDGRVTILSSGGYTVYDAGREVATVQVKREVDEGVMDRIKISFSVDGNSVSSTVVAPESGQTKVYAFDLSGYGKPDSVGASPIFVSGPGKEKEGSVTSSAEIPSGEISSVRGNVYSLGEDYFYEVPMDGLVSIWTFSGDATDGWGDNDGILMNGASVVDGELVLDGDGDYVRVGDISNLEGMDGLTISVWVNPTGTGDSNQRIIDKGYNTAYALYYSRPNFGVGLVTNLASVNDADCGDLVSREWNYVVVTWSSLSGLYKCYINGVDNGLGGTLLGDSIAVNTNSFNIGKYSGSDEFNGSIDNVMVYNRVLSEDEVKEVYEIQMR